MPPDDANPPPPRGVESLSPSQHLPQRKVRKILDTTGGAP